jgi:hypothetical protein
MRESSTAFSIKKEFLMGLLDDAKDKAAGLAGKATEMADKAKAAGEATTGAATDAAGDAAGAATGAAGGLLDKAKGMIPDGLMDKAEGLLDKAVDALPDSIESKVEGLVDKAKGMLGMDKKD